MLGNLRLYSGLVLFAYVVLHLFNHALGIISIEAMDAGLPFTLTPWRTVTGTVILAGAALIHIGVVLANLYSRRTLRMARWQASQTWLGLLIPFSLIGHVVASRGLYEAFGTRGNYHSELVVLWHYRPDFGFLQGMLVLIAWTHACIGLHAWLRLKPWYAERQAYVLALAILWPALALAGYVSAGMQVLRNAADAKWIESVMTQAGFTAPVFDWVTLWMNRGVLAYLLLLLSLLTVRGLREWYARGSGYRLRYDDRLTVPVRPGMTVLEALRAARVPHASVCGGRGRCSTCRVHIDSGGEHLPMPHEHELRVLRRIGAPSSVRLACQMRPVTDLAVTPLLPASATAASAMENARYRVTEERQVAVLIADMRRFTRLAESRLPYDVVFVLNRFRSEMGQAIQSAGGVVNEFVGDSVMALFGLDGDMASGCQQAVIAAQSMLQRLEQLNRSLIAELGEPLQIGIGIHAGPVIVGDVDYDAKGITVVGDVVNIASRLEELTKTFGSQIVMSQEAAGHVPNGIDDWQDQEVELRGRAGSMTVRFPTAL